MTPYKNPWLEGWMRAMNAASQFWLRPMGYTALPRPSEGEPRHADPAEAPAPAVTASMTLRSLEFTDIELRDALHARLAELNAFLNDTIAGQFVRRAAMSEELDGLRSDLDQALGTLDRLREERDALAAELGARGEAVESERQALADRVLALELALGERDANLEALGADRDALVVRIDEIRAESARMQDALDEEVRRLNGDVARLEAELGDAVRAVEQAHGRADAGAARIAWLEPAVETMRAELDATAAERDELRERLAPVVEALEQARRELDSTAVLAPAYAAVRADLENVAAERDALALRVVALEGQLTDQLAAHDGARHASAAHEARIRELEPQLVAVRSEVDRVRRERDQLAERVAIIEPQLADQLAAHDTTRHASATHEARIRELEPQLVAARSEVDRVRRERDQLAERVATIEPQLADQLAAHDTTRHASATHEARIRELEPQLVAARSEVDRVRRERDQLAERVATIEPQLADQLAAHDTTWHASAAHEARIRELEPQLVAVRSEVDRVRRERDQLAERVATIEPQLGRAVEDRDEAHRASERLQAQANTMEPVILGLRADVQRLAEEREALVGHVGALEAALVQRPPATMTDPGSHVARPATSEAPRDVQKPGSAASREPAAEPASARAWPFQLAAPASEPAAASTAPVTRLPQRRAAVELHFRKPPGWADTVFMHVWTPSGPLSVWPGVRMTAEGGGWHGGRAEGVGEVMVVFNDSCGHQTGDLRREGDGWFADGEWRDERPAGAADVVRLANYPGRGDKALPR